MEVSAFGSVSLVSGSNGESNANENENKGFDNLAVTETTFPIIRPNPSVVAFLQVSPSSDEILRSSYLSIFLVPIAFPSLFDWRMRLKIVAKTYFGDETIEIGSVMCYKRNLVRGNWDYEVTGMENISNVQMTMREEKSFRPSIKDRLMIYNDDGQLSGIILGRFPSTVTTNIGKPMMRIIETPGPLICKSGRRIIRIFWDIDGDHSLLAQITRSHERTPGNTVSISTCIQYSKEIELDWHYRSIILSVAIAIEHCIQRNISYINRTIVK